MPLTALFDIVATEANTRHLLSREGFWFLLACRESHFAMLIQAHSGPKWGDFTVWVLDPRQPGNQDPVRSASSWSTDRVRGSLAAIESCGLVRVTIGGDSIEVKLRERWVIDRVTHQPVLPSSDSGDILGKLTIPILPSPEHSSGTALRSAADTVMEELKPGKAVTLMRVFELSERVTQDDLLVLTAICGDDRDYMEILLFRGIADGSAYRTKSFRVREGAVAPPETKELNGEQVRGYLGEQHDCRQFTLVLEGVSVVVDVDPKGRVASIAKKAR